jgi:hypothetical protein
VIGWRSIAVTAALAMAATPLLPACASGSDTDRADQLSAAGSGASTPKQAGITHPAWWYDEYTYRFSDRALGQIDATGADWVVIVPTWYQRTTTTSTIAPERSGRTPSDASLRHAISVAHRNGLDVMLKPHVDLRNDSIDRATIRPSDPAAWFRSYTAFITHYADLARATGVEQLSVGTELAGTSRSTTRWRRVVQAVRARYSGPLTYAANFDEYRQVEFWDAVDLIGIDAYWALSDHPTTDTSALQRAWAPIADRLASLSSRWHRRVLFTEAGYASQRGSTTAPWDWEISTRRSDAEQAAAYTALLRTFWAKSWFAGVHWWMWDDFPGAEEDQTIDYTPHGKAAENVLRRWWL